MRENFGVNDGHTLRGAGSGAIGKIKESEHTRLVGAEVRRLLQEEGQGVFNCTIDKANSTNQSLELVVSQANRQDLDWFIAIHFNAGGGEGVEVYTYEGRQYQDAVDVCKNISALGFKNRGVKAGTGLYVIRKTKAKSMLIEVCFVDTQDADKYLKVAYKAIAKAIVEGILNKKINYTDIPNINNSNTNQSELYRIRKAWDDALSQKGAFSDLNNAKKCADENKMNVYDENGRCVYESVKVDKNAFWNSCNAHAKVNLNPRSEASSNSLDLGDIYINEKVKIKSIVCDNNSFLPIQFYRSKDNSIIDAWVECNKSKFDIHFKNKVINVSSKLLARYSPSSNSNTFGQVYNGESLLVLKEENGFKLCVYRTTGGYAKIGWFTGNYIN